MCPDPSHCANHDRERTCRSGTAFSCKRLRAGPSCLWEKYVLGGKRSSRCSPCAGTEASPGRHGAYRFSEAVADDVACPLAVERLRGASLTLSGSLLQEVLVPLARGWPYCTRVECYWPTGGRWVYSTRVQVACSTDNPWSVHPHPRAVADLNRPRPEATR